MKRYLAFYGEYIPREGGMNNFVGDFDTLQEAIKFLNMMDGNKKGKYKWLSSWGHIFDSQDRDIVWRR